MDKDFKMLTFDEDNFDLSSHHKEANANAQAMAHAQRVRRQVNIAKVVLVLMLFAAGFCVYYLINEYITRQGYDAFHALSLKQIYLPRVVD